MTFLKALKRVKDSYPSFFAMQVDSKGFKDVLGFLYKKDRDDWVSKHPAMRGALKSTGKTVRMAKRQGSILWFPSERARLERDYEQRSRKGF